MPRDPDVALDDLELVVLGDELHVEGTLDVQRLRDLQSDALDLAQRLLVQVLRRRHQRRVACENFTATIRNTFDYF